jgi:hypothetical protein
MKSTRDPYLPGQSSRAKTRAFASLSPAEGCNTWKLGAACHHITNITSTSAHPQQINLSSKTSRAPLSQVSTYIDSHFFKSVLWGLLLKDGMFSGLVSLIDSDS